MSQIGGLPGQNILKSGLGFASFMTKSTSPTLCFSIYFGIKSPSMFSFLYLVYSTFISKAGISDSDKNEPDDNNLEKSGIFKISICCADI